jgi:hypothetical protein
MREKRLSFARSSRIARARVGPIPGRRSSSSALAVLRLSTPLGAAFAAGRTCASVVHGSATNSSSKVDSATITCMKHLA